MTPTRDEPTRDEMLAAARAIWGSENKALSRGNKIRFGNNGSKSLDLSKLAWFDHEAGSGGGYVALFRAANMPLPMQRRRR